MNHPNDRLSRISPLKSTGIPAGWDYDPIVGDWVNSPTGEDYESLMSDRDKTLLDELFLYTGSSKPKSSRINQFYNLDTDEDWKDYINRLDEEVRNKPIFFPIKFIGLNSPSSHPGTSSTHQICPTIHPKPPTPHRLYQQEIHRLRQVPQRRIFWSRRSHPINRRTTSARNPYRPHPYLRSRFTPRNALHPILRPGTRLL